jgi:hypothetical protein
MGRGQGGRAALESVERVPEIRHGQFGAIADAYGHRLQRIRHRVIDP